MSLAFVSQTSTRRSSLDLSYSDIDPSQFDMQIDSAPDDDVKPPAVMEEERDPLYFCENVVLKVEDRIFSVPRSGLIEHGTYFQSLFTMNQVATNGSIFDAGSSEKHPIVLNGVSKIHFHNFLRLIYPFRGIDPPSGDEHWLGILDLATKWGFHEIKETALTHLEHIFTSSSHYRDPVRALYLCQKYDIRQHIKHQYETLITSITPLDRPAMLAGGIDEETILQLMQLREKWFCGMVWGEKGSKTGFGGLLPCRLSARKIVEDHFAGSSSLVVVEDEAAEETRVREEVSRLSATVKHLEELENTLIEADREKRLAEAKAEAEKRAEEKAERKRAEQEEMARKREAEAPESQAGFAQPNDDELSPVVAADEDNIRSVTSNMSTIPSPEVGPRLERLILLHAEKHDWLKQINELERVGVDDNNPRMKKLRSVVQLHERKMQKYWEKGTSQANFCWSEPRTICLESLNETKSGQEIEAALESLLFPGALSLIFSILVGNKKTMQLKQKMVSAEIREYYAFMPYTVEDAQNRKLSRTVISEDKFADWLFEFRRLVQAGQNQEEPELADPWA